MKLLNRLKKAEEILNPPPERRYIMSPEAIVSHKKALGYFINAGKGGFQKFAYPVFRELLVQNFATELQKDEEVISERLDNFFLHTLTDKERLDFFFEYSFNDCLPDNYDFKFFNLNALKAGCINKIIGI